MLRVDPTDIKAFVEKLGAYRPTPKAFEDLVEAGEKLGISFKELEPAGKGFEKYKVSSRGINPALFREAAPSLYPDRPKVKAFGLLALEKAGFKEAYEIAAASFIQDVAEDLKIV